ncbi:tetratricopeptide repeat protein [Nocardia puris]|uniref:tetratricopeptide repeat protein n=1 Tax=Nocardia puris TaxID=208602 RepID=UPI0018956EAA|nr:tetratricopeptide repeat protein [Nocardia puris]MBF6212590.1 tetratricopeptide repeat protein [Nocardia puris]MBF6369170.1 tetratricopeptide repeat protein [Nocardia puris]MBF6461179.1 tetratricopeptide repeat protein [Nocardia puris]
MHVETRLERARAAKKLGRLDEARRIAGEALASAPDDPALLELLADVAYRLDDTDEALRLGRQAIAADPARVDAYLTVAWASAGLGDKDEALRCAREAVRLAPHSTPVLLALALLLAVYSAQDPAISAEAKELVERAVELTPGDADVHASAADVLHQLHEREAAQAHVDAGLAEDPANENLLRIKARLEVDGFHRYRAAATLRGLLGTRPGDAEARRMLASILWRALLGLVTVLWVYVLATATLSMLLPISALRGASAVFFVLVPFAWFGVFRKLRRRLPPRYIRTRLRDRPSAVLALVMLVGVTLLAWLGGVLVRAELTTGLVRLGYWVMLFAVVAAALSHLALYRAWMRGYADEAEHDGHETYVMVGLVVVVPGGVILLAALGILRFFARQPVAFAVVMTTLCLIALTFVVEAVRALVARWGEWIGPGKILAGLLAVGALAMAGMWWGTVHLTTDHIPGVPQRYGMESSVP